MFDFINRARELKELQAQRARGGLLVVYGRRRVGKTRLLTHWLRGHRGAYSQAIEGLPAMQLEQVYRDLKADGLILRGEFAPKSWVELFELLSLETGKTSVCLDEFPYLVAADPALPSVVQRFVDHKMPKGMTLVLAGSSLRMMHDMFLHRAAPLYGRASKLLPISPMNYLAFAEACGLRATQRDTFAKFSIVGGIPKYWEFVEPKRTAVDLAETLFFGFAPYFNEEPARLLRDEGIAGINPLAVLEAIGRGARKPSEVASRMGTAQANLTRIFEALVDAAILSRTMPFGESARSSKRVLYEIADPALRFHFHVYSPHQSRWANYEHSKKNDLIAGHVGPMFEHWWRAGHAGCAPYWEAGVEFDAVRLETSQGKTRAIVTELKWGELSAAEVMRLEARLKIQWEHSTLMKKYGACEIEVVDSKILKDATTVRRVSAVA